MELNVLSPPLYFFPLLRSYQFDIGELNNVAATTLV
jgi:hypothetical protein